MAQVARISGPLLAANLVRTQANLAVDTDLFHVGHLNRRLGILNNTPSTDIQVLGQTTFDDVYATRLKGGNIEFSTVGARAVVGDINLQSRNLIKAENLQTENLSFNNNDISSLNNSDINFQPNGTGVTHFRKNVNHVGNVDVTGNITIPGNLTVGGNFTFGNEESDTINFSKVDFEQDIVPNRTEDLLNLGSATKRWNDIDTAKLDIGDITIDTNVITTKTFNNNFYIRPSGTGAIVIEDLRFSGTTLTSTGSNDIEFAPGGEDIGISATGSLKVPAGTEAQRPGTFRDVRYNTTTNFFELFSTAYTPLRGIWSEDRQTYVLANAGNYFDFTTNNVTNTTLSNVELNTNKLVSQDNVVIDGATISSEATNQDIVLSATGFINVGDLQIDDANNRIINTSTNPFLLSFTNNVPTQYGHVAFTDTSGIVIPSGSLASRPGNPIVGTTRYNNTLRYLETWYDNAWNNVSGAGDTVTEDYMNEQVFIYTLALG